MLWKRILTKKSVANELEPVLQIEFEKTLSAGFMEKKEGNLGGAIFEKRLYFVLGIVASGTTSREFVPEYSTSPDDRRPLNSQMKLLNNSKTWSRHSLPPPSVVLVFPDHYYYFVPSAVLKCPLAWLPGIPAHREQQKHVIGTSECSVQMSSFASKHLPCLLYSQCHSDRISTCFVRLSGRSTKHSSRLEASFSHFPSLKLLLTSHFSLRIPSEINYLLNYLIPRIRTQPTWATVFWSFGISCWSDIS